jgi:hypothetical protein
LQINNVRIRADPFANPSGRSDRGYAIAQNCDVLNFMPLVVWSPDFSIDQNQIGGSLRQDERRKREREDESENCFIGSNPRLA